MKKPKPKKSQFDPEELERERRRENFIAAMNEFEKLPLILTYRRYVVKGAQKRINDV